MKYYPESQDAAHSDKPLTQNTFCEDLYRQYAARLLTYLGRHLHSLHDAEDMLLDIFLIVLEHTAYLHTLTEARQRTWIWTVARNKVADYHRHQRRRSQVSLQTIEIIADERRTPEQVSLRLEEDEQLHRMIEKLPPSQQEVLSLRFAGQLRCSEIAIVMNKGNGAIRALLSRAFHTLRTLYDE